MRILHIVGDSKFGGGTKVVISLSVMAKQAGHDVDVLTTDPCSQEALRQSGIGVVDADVIWRSIRPWRDLKGLLRLYRMLRAGSYTLVHTHTSKGGLVGRLAAKLAGIPIVIHTVHGFAFHEESPRLELCLYSLLEKLAARCCDKVVTVSEFHRDWAERLGIGGPSKLVAIPNGIQASLPEPRDRRALRASLNLGWDEFVVLATGRLAPQKGLEDLVRAVPLIASRLDTPLKVVLLGDGPLRAGLEALTDACRARDRVVFAGFQAQVSDYLSACDVVALPSLWEGLSIALLEAMAAGKPIVTTRIGSNVEVSRNGECALLVPPHAPAALADAIVELATEPARAWLMGQSASAIFQETYTEDRMSAAYRSLYERMEADLTSSRVRSGGLVLNGSPPASS
jgi:glycosyltransferase involved in cell wall biosynthesis